MESFLTALPQSLVGFAVVLVTLYFGYPFFRNLIEKKRYWDLKERQIMMIKEHASLVKSSPDSLYIKELDEVIEQISIRASRYRPLSDDEIIPAWQRVVACFVGFFASYFIIMCGIYFAGYGFPSFWKVVIAWTAIGALISLSAIWIETSSFLKGTFIGFYVFGITLLVATISFYIGQNA